MELKNITMFLHSCYEPGRKVITFKFYTVCSIFSNSSDCFGWLVCLVGFLPLFNL